jgi:hypothetical protein
MHTSHSTVTGHHKKLRRRGDMATQTFDARFSEHLLQHSAARERQRRMQVHGNPANIQTSGRSVEGKQRTFFSSACVAALGGGAAAPRSDLSAVAAAAAACSFTRASSSLASTSARPSFSVFTCAQRKLDAHAAAEMLQ